MTLPAYEVETDSYWRSAPGHLTMIWPEPTDGPQAISALVANAGNTGDVDHIALELRRCDNAFGGCGLRAVIELWGAGSTPDGIPYPAGWLWWVEWRDGATVLYEQRPGNADTSAPGGDPFTVLLESDASGGFAFSVDGVIIHSGSLAGLPAYALEPTKSGLWFQRTNSLGADVPSTGTLLEMHIADICMGSNTFFDDFDGGCHGGGAGTGFVDDFERANGSLGPDWTWYTTNDESIDPWEIYEGAAIVGPSIDPSPRFMRVGSFPGNTFGEIVVEAFWQVGGAWRSAGQIQINTNTPSTDVTFPSTTSGSGNYLVIQPQVNATTGMSRFRLFVTTSLDTGDSPIYLTPPISAEDATPTTFRFEADTNGDLRAYVNGTLVLSYTTTVVTGDSIFFTLYWPIVDGAHPAPSAPRPRILSVSGGVGSGGVRACDDFERTDVGPGWTQGPVGYYSTEAAAAYSIVDGNWVCAESGFPVDVEAAGTIRTTAEYPGDQGIEMTVGNFFQGHNPTLPANFQNVEGTTFLLLQIDADTGACLGAAIFISVGNSATSIDGNFYVEFFRFDGTTTTIGDESGEQYPLDDWEANPDYLLRFDATVDGHCSFYFNGALMAEEDLTPVGGPHIGLGAQWNRTAYGLSGEPGVLNPGTSFEVRQACSLGEDNGLCPGWEVGPANPFYDELHVPLALEDGVAVGPRDTHPDGGHLVGSTFWSEGKPGNQFIEVCISGLDRGPCYPLEQQMFGSMELWLQGDETTLEREALKIDTGASDDGFLLTEANWYVASGELINGAESCSFYDSPWTPYCDDPVFCIRFECDLDGAQRVYGDLGEAGATSLICEGHSNSGHTGPRYGFSITWDRFETAGGTSPKVLWVRGGLNVNADGGGMCPTPVTTADEWVHDVGWRVGGFRGP